MTGFKIDKKLKCALSQKMEHTNLILLGGYKMTTINLPAINQHNTEDLVTAITSSLNFPRTVLAEQFDIETVWGTLNRE